MEELVEGALIVRAGVPLAERSVEPVNQGLDFLGGAQRKGPLDYNVREGIALRVPLHGGEERVREVGFHPQEHGNRPGVGRFRRLPNELHLRMCGLRFVRDLCRRMVGQVLRRAAASEEEDAK